jgi:predicted metal-binding membrane protein
MATLPAGVAAPAGVALAVFGIAGVSLVLLAALPQAAGIATLVLFLAGWTLMTSAMMLPSSLPFLWAAQRVGGVDASTAAGFGFVAIWFAVGVVLCAGLWVAGDLLAALGPGRAEQIAGVSLMAAVVYQVTPLARSCQRACARPFGIIAQHWRGEGTPRHDALRAGLHYGVSCVGCCVAMIVLMFVFGMHDLFWMAGLALLMVVQKHAVWGRRIALPMAAILMVAGVAIVAGWWSVPLRSLRALCGG